MYFELFSEKRPQAELIFSFFEADFSGESDIFDVLPEAGLLYFLGKQPVDQKLFSALGDYLCDKISDL